MPGAMSATTVPATAGNTNGKPKSFTSQPFVNGKDSESDSDDAPLVKKANGANGRAKAATKRRVKKESDDDVSDADDKPLVKRKAPAKKKRKVDDDDVDPGSPDEKPAPKRASKGTRAKKMKDEEDVSGSEAPVPVKKRGANAKEAKEKGAKKGKTKKEEEESEEVFRWWEQDAQGDGTAKWQTLVHNGVFFPPPYEPLPKKVKMKYDGKR